MTAPLDPSTGEPGEVVDDRTFVEEPASPLSFVTAQVAGQSCTGHPNADQHAELAQALTTEIRSVLALPRPPHARAGPPSRAVLVVLEGGDAGGVL